MISNSSHCNNQKRLNYKSLVFNDKGELWKLQDKIKFQKDDLFFQRAFADPGPEGNQQNFQELQSTGIMNWKLKEPPTHNCLLSSKKEGGRLGGRFKKQSKISVVLLKFQWKEEPCVKHTTGLLHKHLPDFEAVWGKRLKS